MVRMERNWDEVDDFVRFWSSVPGVDQVRIKADETNLMQPSSGHAAEDWKHPCHYLWRGPMYVKHNGDVYPCCHGELPELSMGNVLHEPFAAIWSRARYRAFRDPSGPLPHHPRCLTCKDAQEP